ncbi:hypothetical protein PIB30_092597 [Stylosanthes scabra]|uniref:Aminotransferase-like plant mobile domain-containing protein n=1 Tax=Stylosanthes scabra TaxID=79078 RepID=A0ABU6VTD8_9FABA|nr:hypothetical protein [Stylosanthes scabra]
MSRVKQASKHARTDPNAPQPPPHLSQTPVERWFAEDDERTAYDERLSRMEILPPKYIGYRVLPDEKYPEFWRLIDIQGLRPFLYMCGRYYPHFVVAAFTTIFIQEDPDEEEGERFALGFCLGGREYKFTLAALVTSWGLKDEGDTLKGGSNPHGTWNEFDKVEAMRDLRLEHAASGKYVVSRMTIDHRLLSYVLSYVLLPRKSNYGTATEEDLLILWAIVKGKQIHWPYLMAHRMLRYSQGKASSFLGLVHLWTGIIEMASLDLSREEVVTPGPTNIITTSTRCKGIWLVRQMQPRTLVRKLLGTCLCWTFSPNLQSVLHLRLSERIDSLDTHMANQDVDIRSLRDEFRSFKGEDVMFDLPRHQDGAPAQD